MGFGILFIGYFFLVNPSYFQYTDIIGAAFMLLGLYRLSRINRSFRIAMITETLFFVFSAAEITLVIVEAFLTKNELAAVTSYIGALRYALILVLTVFILKGIIEVSAEVEANSLLSRAKTSLPLSAIFGVAAILELPFLTELNKTASIVLGWIAFAVILSVVVYTVNVLIVIYRAYLGICMPSDVKPTTTAKGGLMDKYWSHLEQKSQSYADYKRQRRESKNKRKK